MNLKQPSKQPELAQKRLQITPKTKKERKQKTENFYKMKVISQYKKTPDPNPTPKRERNGLKIKNEKNDNESYQSI